MDGPGDVLYEFFIGARPVAGAPRGRGGGCLGGASGDSLLVSRRGCGYIRYRGPGGTGAGGGGSGPFPARGGPGGVRRGTRRRAPTDLGVADPAGKENDKWRVGRRGLRSRRLPVGALVGTRAQAPPPADSPGVSPRVGIVCPPTPAPLPPPRTQGEDVRLRPQA